MRVQMPPSYSGARASIATMCACVGSPIVSAPASIMKRSSTPVLKRVPRIRKLSAGWSPCASTPQASRSQARLDSKPPAASTQLRAAMRSAPTKAATKRPSCSCEPLDRRVVADLHAKPLGAAVVGVDERLAAAHEERVGARRVQCTRQRRLEAHAVALHPRPAGRGGPDHEPRQALVGGAARHLEQVLPVLLFGIGIDQHILWRVVHAAQVARVLRVAAAPVARRGLEQQHRRARFARHQGRAQRGVAASDHQDVDQCHSTSFRAQDSSRPARTSNRRSAPGTRGTRPTGRTAKARCNGFLASRQVLGSPVEFANRRLLVRRSLIRVQVGEPPAHRGGR